LTNLNTLFIDFNSLSGSMPTQLINCPLNTLFFQKNQLNGTFPTLIFNISSLLTLRGNNNYFSGTIPTEIGNIQNAITIILSTNNFTGNIPTQIGLLTKLTTLGLNGNDLSGTIPTEIGLMSKLSSLQLNTNYLSGTIPTQIALAASINTLKLNNNNLTGTLPPQFSALSFPNPGIFDVSNNYLSGTIPTSYFNTIWSGGTLNFYNNYLTGSSSLWQSKIQSKMTLGSQTKLKIMIGNGFYCPNITYSIAVSFMNQGGDNKTYCINVTSAGCNILFSNDECNMYQFYMNMTSTGSLPNYSDQLIRPCNWVGLTCDSSYDILTINWSGYGIIGPVNLFPSALIHLISINLSTNYFSGSLTSGVFDDMSNLTTVNLANNLISGSYPWNCSLHISSSTHLLDNNTFSGSINSMSVFGCAATISASHTQLSGTVNAALLTGSTGPLSNLDLQYSLITGISTDINSGVTPGSMNSLLILTGNNVSCP